MTNFSKLKPTDIKTLYDQGENITHLLRQSDQSGINTDEIIELAYDLQSGSYSKLMLDDVGTSNKRSAYISEVVGIIKKYCPEPKSLFKGGTGECVTLVPMLKGFDCEIAHIRGLDISWSRLAYGRHWLAQNNLKHVQLAMGALSHIPFLDCSFDIVVTSHAMEPNGGREEEILRELHRIAGNFIFLSEPCYEIADQAGQDRMDKLGYVKDLEGTARRLGFNVVEKCILKHSMNPLNPTAVLVIAKPTNLISHPVYACPLSKKRLTQYDSCYYSNEYLCAYPIIEGIPCLRQSAAIVASKLPDLSGA